MHLIKNCMRLPVHQRNSPTQIIGRLIDRTRVSTAIGWKSWLLTAKLKHRLKFLSSVLRALFLLKTGFWLSYCQISADLDKILHTPIVVRNTLGANLDRDRRVGGSRPNQKDYVFVILATHPKSYRDDGSPRFWRQTVRVEVRTGAIVKNSRIL